MEKFEYSEKEKILLERAVVPFAVYQLVDNKVVTLALSKGYCDLFGYPDHKSAYDSVKHDMYRNVHPDDKVLLSDTIISFVLEDAKYDTVFRNKIGDEYRMIRAYGKHSFPKENVRLGVVWFTDEGPYVDKLEKTSLRDSLNIDLETKLKVGKYYSRLHYDYLTGLPGMTYFIELAIDTRKKLKNEGKIPAFVYMDFSGMRGFNRRFGYSEGDKLLKAFASLLLKYFPKENCSRFAQDNFAVCVDSENIEEKIGGLLKEIPDINDGNSLPVRVGIYLDDYNDVEIPTACDRAKYAISENKNTFESYYKIFDDDMLRRASNRQYIIENIDRAINEKWIQVYFQPIIRAANGRVCDEEALSRWIDPEKGFLSPADFIPVLEESKLIYKLDLYVLDQMLEKMRKQKERGLFIVPSSVNLSRYDFDSCDIVDEITKRVDASGISRDLITIEITESVLGSNFDFMKEQINRFRSLGFQVWMDDFGSGYSSLDVLQSVRFDLVKLDMRFMKQFDNGYKSRIIVTELIKLAISLGIETVAEGVETQEQVDFLKTVGCTKLQGFYFCKPISVDEIFNRYKIGAQIGFENPDESEYYTSIGKVNLYDLSIVSNEEIDDVQKYFDTLPMAILESDGKQIRTVRGNPSFADYMERFFPEQDSEQLTVYDEYNDDFGFKTIHSIKKCCEEERVIFVDEVSPDGELIHIFLRRIAENPVSGLTACVFAVLGITEKDEEKVTYGRIAQALAADYFSLYYVNLETDDFTEYVSDNVSEKLVVVRNDVDFFNASSRDALKYIFEDDRERFINEFSKENVLKMMTESGSFSISYRLMIDGLPVDVNMKATHMLDDNKYIIIGVSRAG